MLRVMFDKGLVRRKRSGRGHQWSAAVTQEAAARSMVGKIVDGIFDGSASRLVAHLVEAGQLSAEELAELRTIIAQNMKTNKRVSRRGAETQRNSI
jgi:predicted transcriptional regulator